MTQKCVARLTDFSQRLRNRVDFAAKEAALPRLEVFVAMSRGYNSLVFDSCEQDCAGELM